MVVIYNSPELIQDEELTFLSFNQTVNKEFSVSDILSSDLWNVTVLKVDSLYKCIPLFNCDEIVSSNANDIVLDGNKCILLNEESDTIIECISDDTGAIHYYSLQLYAFTPYSTLDVIDEVTVYCIVYDEYLNTLNNVEVNILIDDEVISTVVTDNQGIARFKVTEPCEVSFCYNGTDLSNTITISGGE